MSEWQPLSTVPRDGRWVLVWGEDMDYSVYRYGPGIIAADDPQPTHWMPLAAPPTAEVVTSILQHTIEPGI